MSNFTDTYIKGLKSLAKRYEEYEGGGFGIRISPNGLKTWIYRYKMNGKTDKLTLGHYPPMSLANAKKRFAELSGLRREGLAPKDVIEQQEQVVKILVGEALRIDPVVIEKCLGHKMPRIMATYNKNEMLPHRKEALNSWGHRLIERDWISLLTDVLYTQAF